jgi:5-methylcytosine-specific restriction endonuclease McrA
MTALSLKEQIARTDSTFVRSGDAWIGKCLICNGRLSFDARTGFGANVEHIVPRTEGGTNDLLNVALTHPRCNAEKGRNWDNRKSRSDPARYQALVARFLERRKARWREASFSPARSGARVPDSEPLWVHDLRR